MVQNTMCASCSTCSSSLRSWSRLSRGMALPPPPPPPLPPPRLEPSQTTFSTASSASSLSATTCASTTAPSTRFFSSVARANSARRSGPASSFIACAQLCTLALKRGRHFAAFVFLSRTSLISLLSASLLAAPRFHALASFFSATVLMVQSSTEAAACLPIRTTSGWYGLPYSSRNGRRCASSLLSSSSTAALDCAHTRMRPRRLCGPLEDTVSPTVRRIESR
mmetsp:Transcript_3903/g.8260  ORF Transcript_3903/g.8260 Transcript_3903/m.8260 type:complete len:223 (+) Transcript_3903:1533-2201(+)